MKQESEDELMDFVEDLEIKGSEAMDTVSPLIGPLPENAGGAEDDDMNNYPNFKVFGEEDESRGEATFRYTVTNFSKIKESVLSPPCFIRNLPWKIMVMPRTNQHHPQGNLKSMGYFLQCNGDSDLASWTCSATAELRILSQKEGIEDMSRKITHMFYAKENDWGFSFFMSWNDILDPSKGWIKDDSIILEAWVQADAPHGVSWDSKKHTGYVGLKNQGATCYMNSLLQTLFFTNKLRKAVYQMPTESDDSSKNVALALQRVFYDLQFNDKPVGTKRLTKSFGWETLDSFMQHDVQELCRVLLDNMESKMKGTCVEGTIPKLFEGKMISYIKCKQVDFESSRTEAFLDIQLNIKDKKDIYESFDDYVAEETLEGENKYDAGDYGLQDAAKGIIFDYFPPVLHLHLLRFQYDPCSDTNVKINDRFEFPEKLDLNKYEQTQQAADAHYTLHAVLVHSGDNHGGHYVVFINPKVDGKWCKFDDDVVSCCSKQDAVDNNFGGNDGTDNEVNVRHSTNAYMLVYIRDSAVADVLQPVTIDNIQEQLTERFKEERKVEAIRRKERSEQHLYFTMNVYTEDSWMLHRGLDLFCEKTPSIQFKVHKQSPLAEVTKLVADELKWPVEGVRLWPISARQNNSVRPLRVSSNEPEDSYSPPVFDSVNGQNIFAELSSPLSPMKPLPPSENNVHVMIFFKYYDPKSNFISYCGVGHFERTKKLVELFPFLREKANLPKDTPLLLFEEENHTAVNQLPIDEPLYMAIKELMDGDIIVFQKDEPGVPSAKDAFTEIQNLVEVVFCDKNNPNDPGLLIELSQKSNYTQMASKLAMRLGTDSNLLQFFKNMNYRDGPGCPVRHTFEGTLKDLLLYTKPRAPKKIYYQQLTIPIAELENKKLIKCTYVNLNNLKDEAKELELYPRKEGTVSDLLEEARKVIEFSDNSTKKLRLLEIASCKIMQLLSEDTPLDTLSATGTKNYRIEEIPADQLILEPGEFFVPVAHFQKEAYQTFGTPFLVKVRNREPFASVKEKIHKQLDKEKDFDKFKFAIIAARCSYINDDEPYVFNKDEITAHNTHHTDIMPGPNTLIKFWIGLDHMNKAQKRSKYTPVEKAIKIHN